MRHCTILLALLVVGCVQQETEPTSLDRLIEKQSAEMNARISAAKAYREAGEAEAKQFWQRRNAALEDGRIKVGMTDTEFLRLWDPKKSGAEVSKSHFAGHDILTADYIDCTDRVYPACRHVVFTFDNGILDSWHDYTL